VVQVDASTPIPEKFDVLLAVQPSSLGPDQMKNFIAAVRGGQKTAIFEDPFPLLNPQIPGTAAPKMPPGSDNPFMQQRQPPQPKGDITELWSLLGVDFTADKVIWQDYNPFPKLPNLPHEWVFVTPESGAKEAFSTESPVSSDLQQVLFLFPGSVSGLNSSDMKFKQLVTTNNKTGTLRADQIMERGFMGQAQMNPDIPLLEKPTNDTYILAAQIRGKAPAATTASLPGLNLPIGHPPFENQPMSDQEAKTETQAEPPAKVEEPAEAPAEEKPVEAPAPDAKPAEAAPADAAPNADAAASPADAAEPAEPAKPAGEAEINVVLVADIDCLFGEFFRLRSRGTDASDEIDFQFDNVPFVLNVLDVLADDNRFVEIRTRRPVHRSLTQLQKQTESAHDKANKAREKFQQDFDNARLKAQTAFEQKIQSLQKREGVNRQQAATDVMAAQQQGQRELDVKLETLKNERDQALKAAQRELDKNIHAVQDKYKLWAILLPPIPPLVVGLFVFFNRRAREREGVSRARLR